MKYIALNNICDVRDGTHDSPKYVQEGFPLITSKNIVNGKLDLSTVSYLTQEDYDKINERSKVDEGDIIMPMIGTIGNPLLIEDFCDFAIKNVALIKFPNKEISNRFIWYFLKSGAFKKYVAEKNKGGTQKFLSLGDIRSMKVPNIEYSKQISVVEKLDAVYKLIAQRTEELQLLDDLIKARFVEMFGDARENPNGYTTVPFIDIIEYMGDIGSNGANKVVVDHLDMKDEEDYAMMVRFTNFTKNDFTDDVKYVSKEAYDFFKKSQIFGGELIICKIGSAGQNYVMPYLNRPVSLGLNQIMVRIKENILMPYLYQYLHTDYGEFLISGCINGAVTKTITKTELKKIPVMLPPMELQNEFAEFVKQVDKSKVAVKKALDETQLLFNSLMQQYFA